MAAALWGKTWRTTQRAPRPCALAAPHHRGEADQRARVLREEDRPVARVEEILPARPHLAPVERALRREPQPLAGDRREQVERGLDVHVLERPDLHGGTLARGGGVGSGLPAAPTTGGAPRPGGEEGAS